MSSIPQSQEKVFVLGFHKTGTSSIAQALSTLGYRTIHGDPRTRSGGTEGRSLLDDYIRKGNFNLPTFQLYDAFADNPYFTIWQEIVELYPNATYILTVRDETEWIESCVRYYSGKRVRPMREWMFGQYADPSRDAQSREAWLSRYRAHNEDVAKHFRAAGKRLLIFNIFEGDSWGTLCAYLQKDVPAVAFPHKNATDGRTPRGKARISRTLRTVLQRIVAKRRGQ